jgi:hypothetical protein
MEVRETYSKRIGRQICENLAAREQLETPLEKAYRLATSPQ